MVEPGVPELTNELIDLGLIATPARALDVMHPSLSPGLRRIGNHGVHRTLTLLTHPACWRRIPPNLKDWLHKLLGHTEKLLDPVALIERMIEGNFKKICIANPISNDRIHAYSQQPDVG